MKNIDWWLDPNNKLILELPVSVVKDGEYYCIAGNDETKKLIGEDFMGISTYAKTLEKAVSNYFELLKYHHEYEVKYRTKYQRWVPFRKGNWSSIGGTWFVIFGINIYFRYGNGMKGGWYIPFTKLNIRIYNEWKLYNRLYKNVKNVH